MSNFEIEVLKNIVKYFNVSKESILKSEYICSFGNSEKNKAEVREILRIKKFDSLNNLEDDSKELNSDLIFIFKVTILNNKTYFVVFIDPFELNDSMYIEFVYEV